jgi:N-acetylglucosamine-6-sulfatase
VHGPYQPADRHKDLYADEPLPKREGVKDVDNVGKPALTRKVAPPPVGHPAYGVTDDIIRDQLRCIVAVDEGVGRILQALEVKNQLENTLVIFTSDNGYFWNEHHLGDKRAAYEESIRVPMVMRFPKLIKAGTRVKEMVLNVDIAPTFTDLAKAEPIAGAHGRSLVPLLSGDASRWRESALFEYFFEKPYPNIETWHAVRTADWKYIHHDNLEGMDELYHLSADPNEMKNVIHDQAAAEKLAALRTELTTLREATK